MYSCRLQWHSREDMSLFVGQLQDGLQMDDDIRVEDMEVPGATQKQTWEDVQLGEDLTVKQGTEVRALLREFADVFSDLPGRTEMSEHVVKTTVDQPVKRRPYHVPHSLRDAMKRELKMMLEAGIIEESHSLWASPVVLVGKPDGSHRFCVDYRELNRVTVIDPYPVPCMDDLLDELGEAKFISTLDLTREYWQVPLSPDAKEKSAFIT